MVLIECKGESMGTVFGSLKCTKSEILPVVFRYQDLWTPVNYSYFLYQIMNDSKNSISFEILFEQISKQIECLMFLTFKFLSGSLDLFIIRNNTRNILGINLDNNIIRRETR